MGVKSRKDESADGCHLDTTQEKKKTMIESSQEEIKATVRAIQEKINAAIISIGPKLVETTGNRVEDIMSSVDQWTHHFC